MLNKNKFKSSRVKPSRAFLKKILIVVTFELLWFGLLAILTLLFNWPIQSTSLYILLGMAVAVGCGIIVDTFTFPTRKHLVNQLARDELRLDAVENQVGLVLKRLDKVTGSDHKTLKK